MKLNLNSNIERTIKSHASKPYTENPQATTLKSKSLKRTIPSFAKVPKSTEVAIKHKKGYCTRCSEFKTLDHFYARGNDKYSSWCKECTRDYNRLKKEGVTADCTNSRRTCSRCKRSRYNTAFYASQPYWCKDCMREVGREKRALEKKRKLAKVVARPQKQAKSDWDALLNGEDLPTPNLM